MGFMNDLVKFMFQNIRVNFRWYQAGLLNLKGSSDSKTIARPTKIGSFFWGKKATKKATNSSYTTCSPFAFGIQDQKLVAKIGT